MLILNFAHPLLPEHRAQVEVLAGEPVDRVVDVSTQFDPARPFPEQARELVGGVTLSAEDWTRPLLVNLPAHSAIAALVLTQLHGRLGHFPTILRLRPVVGAVVTRFEVAELINLQAAREEERAQRQI